MSKNGIKRVVVGMDGSEATLAALQWTIALAKQVGSHVVAVHAIEPPPTFEYAFGYNFATPVNLDEEWRTNVKREFEDEWCRGLDDTALAYRTILEDGRAADVIAAVAARLDA